MDELVTQTVVVEKGQEKTFVKAQRERIGELVEEIKREKQRKADLEDRVQAYDEIKRRLAEDKSNATTDQKLQKLL